jgi:diacylglycerol kinase (ATP)
MANARPTAAAPSRERRASRPPSDSTGRRRTGKNPRVPDPPASIALIVNPASGAGSDPDVIGGLLREYGVDVALFAPDALEAAAVSGADRLVVASGDGAIGPAAAAAARAGVPLAVIPVGTANDFARGQGLPAGPHSTAHLAALGTRLRALDLAWIGQPAATGARGREPPAGIRGRPFVNAASAGLASLAGEAATDMKPMLGPVAYFAGALWSGLSGRPIACAVTADGVGVFEGKAWQVTIAGTGSFGAGSQLEVADARDGLLDLAVLEAGSRLALVRYAYGLRTHRLTAQAGVRHVPAAHVQLRLEKSTTLNVDGELIPAGETIDLHVEREAFRLVVPDQPGGDSPS